jgi:hypothetical protein
VFISCAVTPDRVIADRTVRTRRAVISRPVEIRGSRIGRTPGLGAFGQPGRRGMRALLASASGPVRCLLRCWPLAGRPGLGARGGLLSGTGPLVPVVVGHGRPLTVHQHVARCHPLSRMGPRLDTLRTRSFHAERGIVYHAGTASPGGDLGQARWLLPVLAGRQARTARREADGPAPACGTHDGRTD